MFRQPLQAEEHFVVTVCTLAQGGGRNDDDCILTTGYRRRRSEAEGDVTRGYCEAVSVAKARIVHRGRSPRSWHVKSPLRTPPPTGSWRACSHDSGLFSGSSYRTRHSSSMPTPSWSLTRCATRCCWERNRSTTTKTDRRAEVMQAPAIHSLKLTNWQIRQLALPIASTLAAALADSQLHAFRAGEQNEDSDLQFVDLSKVLPVTPQRSDTDGQPGHQDLLRKLFGKLQEPIQAPSRTLRPSAEGTKSRSTRTSQTREPSEDLTLLSDAQPLWNRR